MQIIKGLIGHAKGEDGISRGGWGRVVTWPRVRAASGPRQATWGMQWGELEARRPDRRLRNSPGEQ